jgi:hypothetical protein
MHGFLKRTTIGNDMRYSIEFDLEQVQGPCAAACPPYMSLSQLLEFGDDVERSEEVAQVVDANQEWEICNITGKEDVNGVVHYLVEWNPTLMPEREEVGEEVRGTAPSASNTREGEGGDYS